MSLLEHPSLRRRSEFLSAVRRSRKLHRPWIYPPDTPEAFDALLRKLEKKTHLAWWVCTDSGELAGAINISEIVRGNFCSAYLGYYAFIPHNGKGLMTRGLADVLAEAFTRQKLHRLEANIQPGNVASIELVKRLGFRLEGLSEKYLKIGGRWRDHERWAITAEDWRKLRRGVKQ
jgi:ribosomal-protein-alanine N-acetyltransferase